MPTTEKTRQVNDLIKKMKRQIRVNGYQHSATMHYLNNYGYQFDQTLAYLPFNFSNRFFFIIFISLSYNHCTNNETCDKVVYW